MSTLDMNKRNKSYSKVYLKRALSFVPFTLFVMLFGFIYEMFSHGVYSNYMIYAFAPLLLLGVVFWLVMGIKFPLVRLSEGFVNCWNALAGTLGVGFLVQGVLDIYGTTNRLCGIYWIISLLLFALSLFFGMFSQMKREV